MVSQTSKLSFVTLGVVGWILILSACSYIQARVGRTTQNYPVQGILPCPFQGGCGKAPYPHLDAPTNYPYPTYGDKSVSYAWWIMSFEIFVLAVSLATIVQIPSLKNGATGLLAVLTTITFFYTSSVYNSSYGIYALTHSLTQDIIIPQVETLASINLYHFWGASASLFAGLLIVDVANVLLLLTIAAPEKAAVEEQ